MDDTRQADELRVAEEAVESVGPRGRRAAHFAATPVPRHFREAPAVQPEGPEAEPAELEVQVEAAHEPIAAPEPAPEERVAPRRARSGAHFAAAPHAAGADVAKTTVLSSPELGDADATVLMPADDSAGADADATVLMSADANADADAGATVLMSPDPAGAVQDEVAQDAPSSWEGMYVIDEDYPSVRPVPFVPETGEDQGVDQDATEPFFVAMDPNFEMGTLRADTSSPSRPASREKRASRDSWAWVKPTLRPLGLAAALALLIWGGVTFSHSLQRGGEASPAATTDAAVEVTQRENKPLTALSAQDMAARVPDAGANAAQPTTTREPAMGEIYGEPIVLPRNTSTGNQNQSYGSGYGWYGGSEGEESQASPESPESAASPASPASPESATSPTAPETTPSAPETTPDPEPTPSAPEPDPAPAPSGGDSAPAAETQAATES